MGIAWIVWYVELAIPPVNFVLACVFRRPAAEIQHKNKKKKSIEVAVNCLNKF
jgi:hypothetical protein